ncbi:MAG: peptide/nickel transport system permease protein [Planctomycetota bacterium]
MPEQQQTSADEAQSSAQAGSWDESTIYSKDYWDLVIEQLSRRPAFKISLAILALLYATAIYAPLLGNDRPYVLEAIDYKGYNTALRTLSPVASSVSRLMKQTPDEYIEKRGENSPETRALAMEVELEAARLRFETMSLYLAEEHLGPLTEFISKLEQSVALAGEGKGEEALTLAGESKTIARALRKEFVPLDPEKPEAGGVNLRGAKSYPLMKSISPYEIFFMVMWVFVLLWPVWNRVLNGLILRNRKESIRVWRKRKFIIVVGGSALCAVLWASIVGGGGSPFDSAPYKTGLTNGDIVAVSEPIFPPFPIGYAETHTEEMFRPPTWTDESEVDEQGYYKTGYRVPKKDPATGLFPPSNPVIVRYGESDVNESSRHLAGTDELGRDFFVRMLWGGRVSLSVGILSAFLLTVIGVVIGSIAGYFGGWIDTSIMRVIEILQSIPAFFLMLMAMAFTDPDVIPPIIAIVVTIAMIRWTGVARLVRGEFLRLREAEFVLAARALGFSNRRTIFRHVLPNAMSPVLVSAAFAVAAGILTESAISYLGFGIQHPGASWGSLVNESKRPEDWWVQVFPGILIFVTVTCYNLVGDAVRDALDPKMKV